MRRPATQLLLARTSQTCARTSRLTGLSIICDHLRCRPAHFELDAHLLDLRCLLFQTRVDCVERHFEFLYLAVLLEELVEQHCVHRVVADSINRAIVIAYYRVRIYFSTSPAIGPNCWRSF